MITIHVNLGIPNQVNFGKALAAGFKVHNVPYTLTPDIKEPGDTHCIIGPWYAYREYLQQDNVLYFDRACWDHPNYTSINWMDCGVKRWQWGQATEDRYHPRLQEKKTGKRTIILCDYGEDGAKLTALIRPQYGEPSVRRHPDNRRYHNEPEIRRSLDDQLDYFDMAAGNKTTALVTAAIKGLSIISYDKHSPITPIAGRVCNLYTGSRRQWIRDLSWHNWSAAEIRSGEAWEYLRAI